jgi:hypothetical protein
MTAASTRRRAPYHYGGYSLSLTLLAAGLASVVSTAERTSTASAQTPHLALPHVGEAAALALGQLVDERPALVLAHHPASVARRAWPSVSVVASKCGLQFNLVIAVPLPEKY